MSLRRLTAATAVRGACLTPDSSVAYRSRGTAEETHLNSTVALPGPSAPRSLSRLALAVCAAIAVQPVFAAEDGAIEEVIVTAQRSAESIQDVPIAVTALSGEMIEDRQIIAATDLQMNAPNVSFTSTNFGGSSFSIRGIGRLVISSSGDAGVSTHINEIPINSNLNAVEYFDVERVEVLRGPQGTLFGRNATGGAINMVAKMPEYEGMKGFVDVELGDYNHQRVKGMFNMPFGENFAIRVAGMQLQRDGYIENVAFGQTDGAGNRLVGIDDDVDGRDLWAARITASWEITDQARAWVMYSQFDEDDDRARITNQVCEQNSLPLQGCLPNGFGFESPHLGTTTGGLFGGFFGALPLGDPGGNVPGSTVTYDYARPTNLGFRDMHTDFEPIFQNEEKLWAGGFSYEFENLSFGLLGAYQETDYLAQQDYNMDVGPTLNDIGIGGYPTSAPAGRAGEDWTDSQCNYNAGTSGLNGGCIANVDQTRIFAFDQASATSEYWTVEAKVNSAFDGPVNFLLGVSAYDSGSSSDYYVAANTLDLLGILTGAYPATFNSTNAPNNEGLETDGIAYFGELYFDLTESLKLTIGLRQNEDNKLVRDANVFLDANFIPGAGGELSREAAFAAGADTFQADRAALYNATDLFNAAVGTAPLSAERLAAVRAIPLVPQPGERRSLTNSPNDFTFRETTGRIGLDWAVNEDTLIYGFFSRGYKPGGFNPPVSDQFQGDIKFDFAEETVDALEVGTKTTMLDGRMTVNAAAFYYDYSGLQITRIANNSSINDNIDARIYGFELESYWLPDFAPGLALDFAYSYLNTSVDGGVSVDPTNRTANNPDWITLNNIDLGAVTGVNYVAVADEVAAAVPGAIGAGAAFPIPGTLYPDGTPAYMSRAYLDAVGVTTSDGLNTNLDGNALPNSPENTIHIGAAYTITPSAIAGSLTARVDYYWQDDMQAREFNTPGDQIDAWDQWNLSLIYESANGRWQARAWVRNLENENNITGHYLTSDTSGFFRNYFLTEPRIFGASVRFSFE